MKYKKSLTNIVVGVLTQGCTLLLGLLIPRLFILGYGSEINGLMSTINQFFAYAALLEAGVGVATMQALYKPLAFDDKESASSILSATKRYYDKVSFWYLLAVVAFAAIYPFCVKVSLSYLTVFFLILFQGLSGVVNFYFQAKMKILLEADGRKYVVANANFVVYLLTSAAKILIVTFGQSVMWVQVSVFAISLLQMIFYSLYFKKKYGWVNLKAEPDFDALKQKNSFLIHQISGLIFSGTDILIVSIFCGLEMASVYTVYNLVFSALRAISGGFFDGFSFLLGQTFNRDREAYLKLHDAVENYYSAFLYGLIFVALLLIMPFMRIYSSGMTDTNYVLPVLGLLFCIKQFLSDGRAVTGNLITIAQHAKQTVSRTITESAINLVTSLIFVNIWGIYGVILGTICALLYRTNDIIIYANRKILGRSPWKSYRILLVNALLFVGVILFNHFVPLPVTGVWSFIGYGCLCFVVVMIVVMTVNSLCNPQAFRYAKEKLAESFRRS